MLSKVGLWSPLKKYPESDSRTQHCRHPRKDPTPAATGFASPLRGGCVHLRLVSLGQYAPQGMARLQKTRVCPHHPSRTPGTQALAQLVGHILGRCALTGANPHTADVRRDTHAMVVNHRCRIGGCSRSLRRGTSRTLCHDLPALRAGVVAQVLMTATPETTPRPAYSQSRA